MGRSFWRTAGSRAEEIGLVELPVAVLPIVRLPFIGTSLTMAGPTISGWLARLMARRRFIGLELHGIDLLDDRDEGLSDLVGHQPDIEIPHERKAKCVAAAIETLLAAGAEPLTSLSAAHRLCGSREDA